MTTSEWWYGPWREMEKRGARGERSARSKDVTFFSEAGRRWALGGCSSAGPPLRPRPAPRADVTLPCPPPALVCAAPRSDRAITHAAPCTTSVLITWRFPFCALVLSLKSEWGAWRGCAFAYVRSLAFTLIFNCRKYSTPPLKAGCIGVILKWVIALQNLGSLIFLRRW